MSLEKLRRSKWQHASIVTGFAIGAVVMTLLCRAGAAAIGEQAARSRATDDLLKSVRDFGPQKSAAPTFQNNLDAVKDALRRGADPNARYGTSTSTVAVTYRWLKRHVPCAPGDADTTLEATDHFPVMLRAVEFGNEPVVHVLLAAGADQSFSGSGSETELYLAAEGRSPTLVKTFLDLGADPNQKSGICISKSDLDTMGNTPLQGGVCSSAVTKLLHKRGADPRLLIRGYQYERQMWTRIESDSARHPVHQTARQSARLQATEREINLSLALMESATTSRTLVASR